MKDGSARDRAFARRLVAWFARARRDLPWRDEPRDPYRVWVSEVMLQQTQVATAVPYFERFLGRFPTVHALAGADELDLAKAWEGLGLYARVRRMHATAKAVVAAGGRFPATAAELQELPGIGPYMAGAVASLAFGARAPAVDGNVMRVLSRLDADGSDVSRPATRARFEARALALMPRARPGAFNEALMELGATVCTPRAPRCDACPVADLCRARAAGAATRFPVKTRKPRAVPVAVAAAVLEREGRLFVVRPERGLLAGVHALPYVEVPAGADARRALRGGLAAAHGFGRVATRGVVGELKHAFSHRDWSVTLYRVEAAGEGAHGAWVPRERVGELALAGWARKALAAL